MKAIKWLFCYISWVLVQQLHAQQQVIVVSTQPLSYHAELQRYLVNQQHWQAIGAKIPVVIGQRGATTDKHEGDLKTPLGVFSLGSGFGTYVQNFVWPYIKLEKNLVCVDDPHSKYYNQLINQKQIAKPHWLSGEQMLLQQPQYSLGLIVNYNTINPKPSRGSCIFMHVWSSPKRGTAGCVAMSRQNMREILMWLDPMLKPVLYTNQT